MNDFQMTYLAKDHLNDLRAEAARQRLAKAAKGARAGRPATTTRAGRRLGLRLHLGRSGA